MIKLLDNDSEAEIGEIDEDLLSAFQEHLAEESLDEYSYNIDAQALASLVSGGADPHLVEVLKKALGKRTSMEVRLEFD